MKKCKVLLLMATCCLALTDWSGNESQGGGGRRQYYGGWNYYPARSYHYCYYNYYPTPTSTTYSYHYAIHYPSTPRYVYYYNPVRRVYWGRCDMYATGENRYSLLAEADRKPVLKDIPESAFPELGLMPTIPDAKDGVRMEPPPDLPKVAATKDLP
jgi:hypothetical protein